MADGPFTWTEWVNKLGKPTQYFYQLILDLWRKTENLDDTANDTALAQIAALRKEIDELALDFGLEVAKGNKAGHKAINKFGVNRVVASGVTADIWSGGLTGGNLVWDAPTASTHTIASTDANDTTGGSGALTVKLWGLTSWTTTEVSETVTMNTGTPPSTGNSYVIIHRMKVVTSGGTTINAGAITATADTGGVVTARIEIGAGQTQMAVYGVPSGETLYIDEIGYTMNKAGGAAALVDVDLLVNSEPQTQLTQFVSKHPAGLQSVGNSALPITFTPPKTIAGPAIVKLQTVSGTNSISVSGWFNGYVVTNGF